MASTLVLTALIGSSSFFGPKTLSLERSRKRISLHGQGPPVVFSSGLFGLMPRFLYGDLFQKMTKEVTLVVLNDAAPVTSDIVDDIANTLAVERVGFFSHSSIDSNILTNNDRVHMAVLCDPVVFPAMKFASIGGVEFTSPAVENDYPVLVIKAGKAYNPKVSTPIPDFLGPDFENEQREIIVDEVGHADLLDDMWAEMGTLVLPWMKGAMSKVVPFADWSSTNNKEDVKSIRAAYRDDVATWALEHLLRSSSDGGEMVVSSEKPLSDDGFIDV